MFIGIGPKTFFFSILIHIHLLLVCLAFLFGNPQEYIRIAFVQRNNKQFQILNLIQSLIGKFKINRNTVRRQKLGFMSLINKAVSRNGNFQVDYFSKSLGLSGLSGDYVGICHKYYPISFIFLKQFPHRTHLRIITNFFQKHILQIISSFPNLISEFLLLFSLQFQLPYMKYTNF